MCRISLHLAVSALLVIGLAGCGPEKTSRQPAGTGGSFPEQFRDIARPIGVTEAYYVRSETLHIGAVPYDDLTLPLVSPDGRFVATENGIAPTFPTIDAAMDAEPPLATTIEIHELVREVPLTMPDGAVEMRPAVQHRFTLDQPAVLGRSCDREGFLIEVPREDGARWIAHVKWETGELTWLVQDDHVNAFAAIGPDGQLAWSRRAVDETHFHLAVMVADDLWTLKNDGVKWMYPVWSPSGKGLFAVQLHDSGTLKATYLHGNSKIAMRQSERSITVSNTARTAAAAQMMASHPAVVGAPSLSQPHLVFFHPTFLRVAIWRPFAPGNASTKMVEKNSFAAAIDPGGFVVLAVDDRLMGHSLDGEMRSLPLANRYYIPRLTTSEDWPYLLLRPTDNPGSVVIVGMSLLPIE